MTFLQSNVDLSTTEFSQKDIEHAKHFFQWALEHFAPDWLDKPQGYFGGLWKANAPHPVSKIIFVAQIFHRLKEEVTKESQPILVEKFNDLIQLPTKKQFVEALTELQYACLLSAAVPEITLEPHTNAEKLNSGSRRTGPDLAVGLSDGEVYFEVTVTYFQELVQWENAVGKFKRRIERILIDHEINRAICLWLPLSFGALHIPQRKMYALCRTIGESSEGQEDLSEYGLVGKIAWRPAISSSGIIMFGKIVIGGPGMEIAQAVAFGTNLVCFDESKLDEHEQSFFRSLRSTLDRKMRQLSDTKQSVLIVKLGHGKVEYKGVLSILANRVWPNPKYDRISVLGIYTPKRSFSKDSSGDKISYSINPNARNKVSPSLRQIMEGKSLRQDNR